MRKACHYVTKFGYNSQFIYLLKKKKKVPENFRFVEQGV